jgi:hypothetical protein
LELKSSDGTVLKASYFAAAKPGPGVLLHQSNGHARPGMIRLGNCRRRESTRLRSIYANLAKAAANLIKD